MFSKDFGFTDIGEMQFEDDLCLDVFHHNVGTHINILNCHGLGGNQKWDYNVKVLCVAIMLLRTCNSPFVCCQYFANVLVVCSCRLMC